MAEALSVKNISKAFPGVLANDNISLSVEKGTIRAIVGENGAGKTTLMNVIYGLYQPDSGQIFINGEEVSFSSPRDAISHGIGMVHQHFKLVPSYTLAQNIALGVEPRKGIFVDESKLNQSVQNIAQKYGFQINEKEITVDVSVGEQQRAEILKALYRGVEILVLDEPTAVLTDMETKELFVMLRNLVEQGITILFISHKLREVLEISDEISVMRAGKLVGTVHRDETDECQLAEMMVGRETIGGRMRNTMEKGSLVMEIKDLNVLDNRDLNAISDVSLSLYSGEIVGGAGVDGNGQEEFVEALLGLRPVSSGKILIDGKEIQDLTTREIRESGVAYIPSDRYRSGVAIDASIWENMVPGEYYVRPFSNGLALSMPEIIQMSGTLIEKFNVATPGLDVKTGNLSGGNIQRVIAARELGLEKAKVVIASQPTRGIDIAGTEAIRQMLVEYANRGAAVFVISADLDEILALSDRVVVFYEGEVMDAGYYDEDIRQRIGWLMTSGKDHCVD
jgi:simple sugar transport system ATP-binding protein